MFPCIFSIKVNFSTRTSCEFVGVLHWILIWSLEFLALLRMLKWHQLHFLYWNFIVPAWPHFFVLHMFSLLWAASLLRCAQRIRKSRVFVFLAALLVPPCAGHPSDKAAFLPQDKAALLAQGTRAPFPVEKLPRAWQLCAERTWHAKQGPLLSSGREEVECMLPWGVTWLWDSGDHTEGGQWPHSGQCETSLSHSGKGKGSGKQRKGKVSISV